MRRATTGRAVTLSLALVLALALALAVVACGSSDEGDTTAPETPAEPGITTPEPTEIDAAAIYNANCAGCHNADGSGGIGPDLRGKDDVAGVAQQIEEGGGTMPAFKGELSAPEIEAVAGYVTSEL